MLTGHVDLGNKLIHLRVVYSICGLLLGLHYMGVYKSRFSQLQLLVPYRTRLQQTTRRLNKE
jgi:hypothetical protein